MIRFYKTPRITKARYPELIWNIDSEESIYLTFDDGPNPETTPWIKHELRKVGAQATFFCLGKNIRENMTLAQELLDEGHVIGNHTYNHLNGWTTINLDYQEDIRACDQQLMILGVHNQLFRPPYGRIKKGQINALKNRRIVMWSHLSWDFDPKLNIEKSIDKMKQAKPGSILVFHDSIKAFENLKMMLPEILSFFTSKGFKLESIK
ncbi:polysaccharide deacetylase family protein [Ekhidna sp. To15]|uniref:polysaccharide deacetylase family protein n=1 Tax=Ekhidna sp. To15 TaxID=3395267 RepID=UPI003F51CCC6